MSWTLTTPDRRSLHVNAWNWRPTLGLLESADVLDADTLALLGYNISVELSGEDARRIATFLDAYLADISAGGRVRLDGSVTTEPDTYEFHREDLAGNYSATVGWLRLLQEFCHAATDGFTCS